MIEILGVIVIIGILAALLLAALQAAKNHSLKVVAKTEIKMIETAWNQYYSEYQMWPSFASEETGVAITGNVATVLHGVNDANTNNSKSLVFMEFRRLNAAGNPINPWGKSHVSNSPPTHFYYAKFDTDYDHVVTNTPAGSEPPTNDVRRSVVVWTYNPDLDVGDTDYVLTSW